MAKRISGLAVTDVASLETHIDKVRGKARSWTLSAPDVRRIADLAEQRLEQMFVATTHRRGACVTARSAGPASTAYKYSVIGAEVVLRRAKDGWRMTDYSCCNVYPCTAERIRIEITPAQAEKSFDTMRRRLRVTVRSLVDSDFAAAA
ncbi:hypothetical protein RPB_3049 [Rhodopseudomonas palustris HaA2]|uniref:Uncharacterized protein n=1 Tax=Rhodopseudomonas palustris (strain HaA2) TaxID=316058 RepID=Q2IVK9_RHOP2|nr:hypothetical protein [Rhodopseudomonas palustris]ABD07751.1 hypothetical protein RPB_3049 [Rhodopseudomonas palustris HaA2]